MAEARCPLTEKMIEGLDGGLLVRLDARSDSAGSSSDAGQGMMGQLELSGERSPLKSVHDADGSPADAARTMTARISSGSNVWIVLRKDLQADH